MAKALVIVESPTKAKTLSRFLGSDFSVQASGGHIMDLPRRKMGVDVEDNFRPEYKVITKRKKILSQIKKDAKLVQSVYLACDPDREGEAICWHLKQSLKTKAKIYRVTFHEITEGQIKQAFARPGSINMHKVEAQQARRVLDRLVGYNLSPLLWKKISRGLSAGRVQSVALRLIVEREREIGLFTPQEYWEIEAQLKKQKTKAKFLAKLDRIGQSKPELKSKEQVEKILDKIRKKEFIVSDIEQRNKKRNPQAPYTTSKLQQEAFNRLHFTADRTMLVAQQLYEGIEIGKKGHLGLITYMRTDSVKVSLEAQKVCRDYISRNFGKQYLPAKPFQYKSKKRAQEAHEAIRPALPLHNPEEIKDYLSPEQYKLYSLIWNKFLASQMNPAIYKLNTISIKAGEFLFKATSSSLEFDGFLKVFDSSEEEKKAPLPPLDKGERLDLLKLNPLQHFTQPPGRFSDASLVKTLEDKGIGRPSTYAPTIRTIIVRNYIRRESGHFFPTELGFTVSDILTKYFPKILDIKFTATLEDELDEVEEGKIPWAKVVRIFYSPFIKELAFAQKKVKKEFIPTREICDLCGRPMIMKWGRHGRFLSCSGFPKCKNARSITTEVKCPRQDCSGFLVERHSKSGRVFYGCSKYPKCRHTAHKLPEVEAKEETNSQSSNQGNNGQIY